MEENKMEDLRGILGENLFKVDGNIIASIQFLVTDGENSAMSVMGKNTDLLQSLIGAFKQHPEIKDLFKTAVMIVEGSPMGGLGGMMGLGGILGMLGGLNRLNGMGDN